MEKAGAGSIALALAIAGFAAGELLIRGTAGPVIDALDGASRPRDSGLAQLAAVDYEPLAVTIGLVALVAGGTLVAGRHLRLPDPARTARAVAVGC